MFHLDNENIGRGYTTEAAKLVVDYALNSFHLHRIEAGVLSHNIGSIRVLKKAGFHIEGIARKNVKINGKWKELVVLAIINPLDYSTKYLDSEGDKNMLEIKTSEVSDGEFNRGVFATQDLKKGQLIHVAPVIAYPNEQHEHIAKTLLDDYAFEYGINHTCLLLGYGMLFNHSYEPNAFYEINFDNHSFDFFAYKDIKAGEEVFINYNGEVDDQEPLWFNKDK